jgi:hypothetical protein
MTSDWRSVIPSYDRFTNLSYVPLYSAGRAFHDIRLEIRDRTRLQKGLYVHLDIRAEVGRPVAVFVLEQGDANCTSYQPRCRQEGLVTASHFETPTCEGQRLPACMMARSLGQMNPIFAIDSRTAALASPWGREVKQLRIPAQPTDHGYILGQQRSQERPDRIGTIHDNSETRLGAQCFQTSDDFQHQLEGQLMFRTELPVVTLLELGNINSCSVLTRLAMKNKADGEAFLKANREKEGVVTLESGLQYQVLQQGNGPSPRPTDRVRTHYHGTLIDGSVFDSSVEQGEPVTFGVTEVIAGWTEALQRMKVGDKWRIFLPSELAYGGQGAGAEIGPNSALIFEIELLGIEE